MCREPPGREPRFIRDERPPLDSLRALIAESAITVEPDLPPMAAGLFGYLGYDMVRLMERLPPPNPDVLGVPDAILVRPTVMVVFDAVRDEISLITPVRPQPGVSAKAAYETALARMDDMAGALERPLPIEERHDPAFVAEPPVSNTTPAEYKNMVAQAQEYIRAGDIFQVVLSQRFEAPFRLPPFSLYRALRRVNPAPFLCYLDFEAFQIVCSSPEILVRVREGAVTIRPIAGTRPRGATPAEDRRLGEELLADPKERAEHLMLLDLGRNDVGRVSSIGTVKVTDSFFLERYSQVMHIVSNVEGRLDPRFDALGALVAGFPAGTVSGAPKVRAMEIIDELETDKRGPYAGCIGYFGANGEMDTCIVLRTAVVKDGRWSSRPEPASSTTPTRRPSSRNASTRLRRSSAPPKRRCASPAAPGGGSRNANLERNRSTAPLLGQRQTGNKGGESAHGDKTSDHVPTPDAIAPQRGNCAACMAFQPFSDFLPSFLGFL